ncbi:hypothetical protein D3C84_1211390 [compost metagenome]
MSFTSDSTGSAAISTRNGCLGSNSLAAFRHSVTARSNRKPSIWNSSTQYRNESRTSCTTRGWEKSRLLPQPVVSTYLPCPSVR